VKDVFRANLLARERYGLEALSAFIEKGGLLLVGSLTLALGYGLYGLCWSFVLVRTIDLTIVRTLSKRAFSERVASAGIDMGFLAQMLWAGIPIGIYYVTLNIYNYIDSVMISVMRSQTEVGWYSASYKIYEGLLVIPVVIGTVLLPRLSQCGQDNADEFSMLVNRGWKYSLILALSVTALGLPLASDLIELVYGDSYTESIVVMQILLAGVAFAYMVNFLQTVIISIDQQKALVVIAVIGLTLNVALNYMIIPTYGYSGAAAVTIFVEAIVFVMLARKLSGLRPGVRNAPVLVQVGACWFVTGGGVLFTALQFSGYLQALIWLVGFLCLLRFFGLITQEEQNTLWEAIRNFFRSREARA
jgi:O-antigen/teichoic acid export membrane protein